jgi:hypothetical protein
MKIKVSFNSHIPFGDRILIEFSELVSYEKISDQVFVLSAWKGKYFDTIIADLEGFKNKGDLDYIVIDE